MTNTLKKRFILFTMAVVTCLLLFIVTAINGLNWMIIERQSDNVLNILVESDGAFHKMEFEGNMAPGRPPQFARPMDMDRMRSERFFIVRMDMDGNVRDVNIDQISSIDTETAKAYAGRVWESGETSGKIEDYKFAVKQMGMNRLIFFMNIAGQQENFYRVLFASSLIAALCWLILLLFVVALSGRVIRPVIAGMEKQKQFITNAGHEMKTPLAIIQSNNDTMALIHGENKYNGHIRTQAKRLNVLMQNLLTLARLDEAIPLTKEPANISEITKELLTVYEEEAKARNLAFSANIEPDIIIPIHQDSFRQLLSTLLDNALKYTPDDGAVSLSVIKNGKHIQIVEENTCQTGMEADPERFFERFYRGDAARTQNKETSGYGIGLSAARAICENFGGTLKAEYPSAERIRFTAQW